MYYVPLSYYLGHLSGRLIGTVIGFLIVATFRLSLLAVYYAGFAILKILELFFKLLCFLLPKIEDLIMYGYHRFRRYREQRYCVR